MRIPEIASAIALGVASACSPTPTPSPVERPIVTPEPASVPLSMYFRIRTCEDFNGDTWCGPEDLPLGRVPLVLRYMTLVNGTPKIVTVGDIETSDIGEIEVPGPYMLGEDFIVGAPEEISQQGGTFCKDVTNLLTPGSRVSRDRYEQVSILYERCAPSPQVLGPLPLDGQS